MNGRCGTTAALSNLKFSAIVFSISQSQQINGIDIGKNRHVYNINLKAGDFLKFGRFVYKSAWFRTALNS